MYMMSIGSRKVQRSRSERLRKASDFEDVSQHLGAIQMSDPCAPPIAVSIGSQSTGLLALYEGTAFLETIQKNFLLQRPNALSSELPKLKATDPELRALLHEIEVRLWVLDSKQNRSLQRPS